MSSGCCHNPTCKPRLLGLSWQQQRSPFKVVQECPCKHLLDVEVVAFNGLAGIVEVGMVKLDAILVMQGLQAVRIKWSAGIGVITMAKWWRNAHRVCVCSDMHTPPCRPSWYFGRHSTAQHTVFIFTLHTTCAIANLTLFE